MIENSLMRTVIVAVLVLTSACAGQSGTQPTDEEDGWGFRPVIMVEPPVPPEVLASCMAGLTVLEFSLLADGTPVNFTIAKSDPPGVFDDAAYVAARRWKFEPPPPADVLVRRYQLPMKFRKPVDCQRRPVMNDTDITSSCVPSGQMELVFTVSTSGNVENLRILSSTLPVQYDLSALKNVRAMKFEPRIVDGKPVARTASMKIDSSAITCNQ